MRANGGGKRNVHGATCSWLTRSLNLYSGSGKNPLSVFSKANRRPPRRPGYVTPSALSAGHDPFAASTALSGMRR